MSNRTGSGPQQVAGAEQSLQPFINLIPSEAGLMAKPTQLSKPDLAAVAEARKFCVSWEKALRELWNRENKIDPVRAGVIADVYAFFRDIGRLDPKGKEMMEVLTSLHSQFNKLFPEYKASFSEFVSNLPETVSKMYNIALGSSWQDQLQPFAGPFESKVFPSPSGYIPAKPLPQTFETNTLLRYLNAASAANDLNWKRIERLPETALVVVTDEKGNTVVRDGKPLVKTLFDPNNRKDAKFLDQQKRLIAAIGIELSNANALIKPSMTTADWAVVSRHVTNALQLDHDRQHDFEKQYGSKIHSHEVVEWGKTAKGWGRVRYTYEKYETPISLAMLAIGSIPLIAEKLAVGGVSLVAAQRLQKLALMSEAYFAGTGIVNAAGELALEKRITYGVILSSAMALSIGGKIAISRMPKGASRAVLGIASQRAGQLVVGSMAVDTAKLVKEWAEYGLTPEEVKALGANVTFMLAPMIMGLALGERSPSKADRKLAQELYAERAELMLKLYGKVGNAFESMEKFASFLEKNKATRESLPTLIKLLGLGGELLGRATPSTMNVRMLNLFEAQSTQTGGTANYAWFRHNVDMMEQILQKTRKMKPSESREAALNELEASLKEAKDTKGSPLARCWMRLAAGFDSAGAAEVAALFRSQAAERIGRSVLFMQPGEELAKLDPAKTSPEKYRQAQEEYAKRMIEQWNHLEFAFTDRQLDQYGVTFGLNLKYVMELADFIGAQVAEAGSKGRNVRVSVHIDWLTKLVLGDQYARYPHPKLDLEFYKISLDFAKRAGAKEVVLHYDPLVSAADYVPLVRAAAERGIAVGFENAFTMKSPNVNVDEKVTDPTKLFNNHSRFVTLEEYTAGMNRIIELAQGMMARGEIPKQPMGNLIGVVYDTGHPLLRLLTPEQAAEMSKKNPDKLCQWENRQYEILTPEEGAAIMDASFGELMLEVHFAARSKNSVIRALYEGKGDMFSTDTHRQDVAGPDGGVDVPTVMKIFEKRKVSYVFESTIFKPEHQRPYEYHGVLRVVSGRVEQAIAVETTQRIMDVFTQFRMTAEQRAAVLSGNVLNDLLSASIQSIPSDALNADAIAKALAPRIDGYLFKIGRPVLIPRERALVPVPLGSRALVPVSAERHSFATAYDMAKEASAATFGESKEYSRAKRLWTSVQERLPLDIAELKLRLSQATRAGNTELIARLKADLTIANNAQEAINRIQQRIAGLEAKGSKIKMYENSILTVDGVEEIFLSLKTAELLLKLPTMDERAKFLMGTFLSPRFAARMMDPNFKPTTVHECILHPLMQSPSGSISELLPLIDAMVENSIRIYGKPKTYNDAHKLYKNAFATLDRLHLAMEKSTLVLLVTGNTMGIKGVAETESIDFVTKKPKMKEHIGSQMSHDTMGAMTTKLYPWVGLLKEAFEARLGIKKKHIKQFTTATF